MVARELRRLLSLLYSKMVSVAPMRALLGLELESWNANYASSSICSPRMLWPVSSLRRSCLWASSVGRAGELLPCELYLAFESCSVNSDLPRRFFILPLFIFASGRLPTLPDGRSDLLDTDLLMLEPA